MPCVPVSAASRVRHGLRRVDIEAVAMRAIWTWNFETLAWDRVY